ncbi:MAG: ATP synthase F0 subunit C [Candidatus Riflebacteria bacterium]|nr:ATP synthase F0 subunit C [Candidatus Riflebacteria bacterium]
MDPTTVVRSTESIAAVLSILVGSSFAAVAQARVICAAMDSMARQPEISGELRFTMIIGLAMIESLAIYCLLVSLILLLLKW